MVQFPTTVDASSSQESKPSKPVQRVGVIGGGQLAWMMADAAKALGIELVIQTPHATDPAVAIASDTILADIDDAAATAQLAATCDVITFENEFIDLEALSPLAQQGVCFRPRLAALAPLLDKYHQRCYLRDIGLPTPEFMTLEDGKLDRQAIGNFGFPLVLKTRRHGYDGQGTFILRTWEDLESLWPKLEQQPVLLEEFVPFERELAIIAARSSAGEVVTHSVVETEQENQVCHRVFAPALVDLAVATQVEAIAQTLLNSLQVVGIFGIELFLTRDGKVLVNEIAPRTHNSGHFTIDACETSQFEQHLRAVGNLPLGNPALKCAGAVMVNLLGYEHSTSDYLDKRQQLAQIPHAHIHWYGKTESRPGRKMGHVTVLLEASADPQAMQTAANRTALKQLAQAVEAIWYNA